MLPLNELFYEALDQNQIQKVEELLFEETSTHGDLMYYELKMVIKVNK